MKTLAVLAVLFLTACATSTPIPLPEGAKGFAIECNQPKQCYQKAAEVCAPGTFSINDKSAQSSGAVVGNNGVVSGGFGTKTTLIVQCSNAK